MAAYQRDQNLLLEILTQAANIEPIRNPDGSIDPGATFESGVGEALGKCGALVNGACGISYTFAGGAVTPVGGKGSVDFYVDQNGDMAAYLTGSGGGYFVPSVADVTVTGVSATLVRGATVDNMSGAGGQFGASAKLVGGPTVEWGFGRNDEGYWHSVSAGGNGGAGVEVHLSVSYSVQIYRSR